MNGSAGSSSRGQVRIGVARMAELFSLDRQTLRFYDAKGYFRPAGRGPNGYRYYLAPQIHELYAFLALRQMGLGLSEVRATLDSVDPEVNLARWAAHDERLGAEIRRLRMQRRGLARARRLALEGLKRAGELSLARMGAFTVMPIATFEPSGGEPRYLESAGKRLLSALEAGDAAMPSFGARVLAERIADGSFDPPEDLLVLWPSAEAVPARLGADLTELEPGLCASYFFRGWYDDLPKGYRRLSGYLAERGLVCAGDSLEINHLDGLSVGDRSLYVTRILIPVRRSRGSGTKLMETAGPGP